LILHVAMEGVADNCRRPPCQLGAACREVLRLSAVIAFVAIGAVMVVTAADVVASPKGRFELSAKGDSVFNRLLQVFSDPESENWDDLPVSPDEGVPSRNLQSQGICTVDERWVAQKWALLSKQEKNAWTDLGWDESIWDQWWGAMVKGVTTTTTTTTITTEYGATTATFTTTSILPPTEQSCWQDLTQDEQDAATALGYTITTWMECKRPNCGWPPGEPLPSSSCLDKMKHLRRKYNYTVDWQSYSQRKRDKLVLLGWDPDGVNWAAGRDPYSYGRVWSELSAREIESARFLGYDAKVWNGCEGQMDSPCLARLTYLEGRLRDYIWEQLPRGKQEKLEDLGWESRAWFEGELPSPMKAEWTGLTSMQRASARIIGYTQDTWARCPNAICTDRFAYVNNRFHGVSWMQMKLSERRAWMLLENSASLWADGNLPATMQMRWEELTPEQQEMATFLGHDMETWQGCNTDWAGPNMTSNATEKDPLAMVRARMYIDRPFSEISGNVYGQRVHTMPTSFIKVFEDAVGRALFCGNPPLSLSAATYIGPDNEPLCVQQANFADQQLQKRRIRVFSVVEGSIQVDFLIRHNRTPDEDTARTLYEALERQIEAKLTSPISHDKDFGRFAKRARLQEIYPIMYETLEQTNAIVQFEDLRREYNSGNKCLLTTDAKLGRTSCVSSGVQFPFSLRLVAAIFVTPLLWI